MNKKDFINALKKYTNYNDEQCLIINNIFENYSLVEKNSKEKVIKDLEKSLKISHEESIKLYNTVYDLLIKSLRRKLKHPFKDNNKDE